MRCRLCFKKAGVMVRVKEKPIYYCDKCFDELRTDRYFFYYEVLPEVCDTVKEV